MLTTSRAVAGEAGVMLVVLKDGEVCTRGGLGRALVVGGLLASEAVSMCAVWVFGLKENISGRV